MITVLFVLIGILVIGIILLVASYLLRRNIGVPHGEVVYSDSSNTPGEIMRATSIPLVGKPDYILKKDDTFIPVEVKTGSTPQTPYKNHIAQLFAYCLLVTDHYGKRPSYGIIRYPDQEVPLEYPENAEVGIRQTIQEMLTKKQSGEYRSEMKTVCKKCREGTHASST